jgi:hypothetical protein
MATRARRVTALSFPDQESEPQPFNAAQWARDHEKRDDERFGMIFRILGAAGMAALSLLGWSLKVQYDGMALSERHAQEQIVAIQALQTHLAK